MSELANITSVQVTWNQPEGGLAVDEFVVSYHRLNGRDGQCSSFQDEGNVTVMVGGEGETILHLKAYYSTYTVNVTGRKGALYNTSSLNFETNSTGKHVTMCTWPSGIQEMKGAMCYISKIGITSPI